MELTFYLKLNEAIPSIEEDFYRSALTETENKEAGQSCSKSSGMAYLPPPLNDATLSAAKIADTALYGIQVAHGNTWNIKTVSGIGLNSSDGPKDVRSPISQQETSQKVQEGYIEHPKMSHSWGPSRNVQMRLGKTHGQHIGQERLREWVQDTLQNSSQFSVQNPNGISQRLSTNPQQKTNTHRYKRKLG
ncbi:hypothetical protein AYI69_g8101 [Smittium culicis]|uniref:Uncharacterized protein n=1 Tax=Smittium culicis TaxID=133412 RepID=A0A1R1XM67_9FUNG|nr:hypothetical protein AYI69_g8101 [Smittium culicis]